MHTFGGCALFRHTPLRGCRSCGRCNLTGTGVYRWLWRHWARGLVLLTKPWTAAYTAVQGHWHTHLHKIALSQPRNPVQLLHFLPFCFWSNSSLTPNLSSNLEGGMHREYMLPLWLFQLCNNISTEFIFLKEGGSFLIGPWLSTGVLVRVLLTVCSASIPHSPQLLSACATGWEPGPEQSAYGQL